MNKVALVTGSSKGLGKASVLKYAKEGYDVKYGARQLRREIQKNIENSIAELILKNEKINAKTICVDFLSLAHKEKIVLDEGQNLEDLGVMLKIKTK